MAPKKRIEKHELIPLHEKLSDAEKEKLLSSLNISFKDLPKMHRNDSAIVEMDVKQGDIIRVSRKSSTAGNTIFYRGVIDA